MQGYYGTLEKSRLCVASSSFFIFNGPRATAYRLVRSVHYIVAPGESLLPPRAAFGSQQLIIPMLEGEKTHDESSQNILLRRSDDERAHYFIISVSFLPASDMGGVVSSHCRLELK